MKSRAKVQKTEPAAGEELFAALDMLEKEKGIPKDYMIENIKKALAAAWKKANPTCGDNADVEIDPEKHEMHLYAKKIISENPTNPSAEISLEEARTRIPNPVVGDTLSIEVKTQEFGRLAAGAAKQILIQSIHEAERNSRASRYAANEREILTAVVSGTDDRTGDIRLEVASMPREGSSSERTEVLLPVSEQAHGEALNVGDRVRVYVVDVRSDRGYPHMHISRTHPGLVKRLFELNVPEIHDGTVEIKSISREAGSRTKMAVWAARPEIDPIGACVGPRGERVNAVVNELRGEKIDIVKYSEDTAKYVAAALAPATVLRVDVAEDQRSCRVIVPDDQLSLAIGKEGQNARLAVKLTGVKIDIKSETQEKEMAAAAGPAEEPNS